MLQRKPRGRAGGESPGAKARRGHLSVDCMKCQFPHREGKMARPLEGLVGVAAKWLAKTTSQLPLPIISGLVWCLSQ